MRLGAPSEQTVPDPTVMPAAALTAVAPRKARFVGANSNGRDLSLLRQRCEEGRLKATIEAVFALEETRQAYELAKSGRTRGKVAICTA